MPLGIFFAGRALTFSDISTHTDGQDRIEVECFVPENDPSLYIDEIQAKEIISHLQEQFSL
jgi:hypothetical protein